MEKANKELHKEQAEYRKIVKALTEKLTTEEPTVYHPRSGTDIQQNGLTR